MANLLSLLLRVVAWLNRGATWVIARLLARLLYLGSSGHTTRINLTTCFPGLNEAARQRLALTSLSHTVLLFFEMAQLRFWDQQRLMEGVSVDGKEYLDRAVAEGNGVLLLVPHLGNWEIMCVFLGLNYQLSALYDRPKVAGVEELILHARQRFGGELHAIDVGGIRSFIKSLKGGAVAAVLPDQVPAYEGGVYAPFFDHPALTMTLPYQLLKRTQATPLLGTVRRVPNPGQAFGRTGYSYALSFVPLPGLDGSDAQATAQSINHAIEQAVIAAPEQYQWEYKRFRRPPEGGKENIYRRQ
ncbi:MAG: lysophospholipid acyltransferase family protein [Pseudomonadota bacterium]